MIESELTHDPFLQFLIPKTKQAKKWSIPDSQKLESTQRYPESPLSAGRKSLASPRWRRPRIPRRNYGKRQRQLSHYGD